MSDYHAAQLPSVLNWLKGMFTNEPQGQTYTAPPPTQYPTSDDVAFARKNDYSYGQPWAPEFEDKSARLLSGDPNKTPMTTITAGGPRLQSLYAGDLPMVPKDVYAKAALASEGSALAKLGFDPNRTALDVTRDPTNVNVLGFHRPSSDEIYANARTPSAIVHEGVHRGIQKLRESPFWDKGFQPDDEELLVRHLMQTKMGDPEKGEDAAISATKNRPIVGLQQQEMARALFDPNRSSFAGKRLDKLKDMEEAAANYIAQKHPGGPR